VKGALTILVTVLLAAQAATADLSPEFLSASAPAISAVFSAFPVVTPEPTLPASLPDLDSLYTSNMISPCDRLLPADSADTPGAQVIQLPPPPSGDALCLSGLLSIGFVQAMRRVRHSHSGLPIWFSDSGRTQVNHSFAVELSSPSFVLCAFDKPLSEPALSLVVWGQGRRGSIPSPQWYAPIPLVRGPPV
jgi:hypothetical protein